MHALRTTRPPGRVLMARAGAAAMASMLAVAGCGRPAAAAGTQVPAPVIGRLTAMAHRAATLNGDPAPGMDHSGGDHARRSAPPVLAASLGPVTHLAVTRSVGGGPYREAWA